jgi:hypothetical protein
VEAGTCHGGMVEGGWRLGHGHRGSLLPVPWAQGQLDAGAMGGWWRLGRGANIAYQSKDWAVGRVLWLAGGA